MKEYFKGKLMFFLCIFNIYLFDVLVIRDGIKLLWISYEYGLRFVIVRNVVYELGIVIIIVIGR